MMQEKDEDQDYIAELDMVWKTILHVFYITLWQNPAWD